MSSPGRPAGGARSAALDAALTLFTEGHTTIALEEIARRAGISRQSLYVHFGSRAGLLVALAQHVDAGGMLEGLIQRVFDAPTALEALDAVVHLHAEYSPAVYPVARVFMAGQRDDEALRVAWEDRMQARRNLYRAVVERMRVEGLLDARWDVDAATDLVFALTSWEVWELLVVDRAWTKDAYRAHLAATLRRALVAKHD